MSSSLIQYHRNKNHSDNISRDTRTITAFYSYSDKQQHSSSPSGSYILFVRDGGSGSDEGNIYIETQSVSVVIPYKDLPKYNKLYVYYIISVILTPDNTNTYYCDKGYKGIYKEMRYWYILTSICWKSLYMSFGDYCYFKENPLSINLSACDRVDKIGNFLDLFNNGYYVYDDPYEICDWVINYETNVVERELYQNELIVNREKMLYELLQIVKRRFAMNEDIVLKIYEYIVFDVEHKI